ncbi:TPM domain-containing protein [Runella sp.]|uniref:TPM domain-containing protein n=1 Tax=Runella sp. TaxID=1960881 RepID=UPI003D1071F9
MQDLSFSKTDQERIVAAIHAAEMATSGEVRVHIEKNCPETDVMERAKQVFAQLGMHQTALKNGVLFYLAVGDRKFAVLGDKGIDESVPTGFWDSIRDQMRAHFVNQAFSEGLSVGIEQAGQQLKKYFPRQDNDTNELSDDISFG